MSGARRSVVFVVAHPDDVAFYMGGTALLLRGQYNLHVIMATRGERGYRWDGKGLPPPSEQVARIREAEEREACAVLGASLELLGLADGGILAERPVINHVASRLSALKPVAVFTHGPQSKPDHAATFLIAYQALHQSGLFWDCECYLTLQDNETTNGRYADIYVNITEVIEEKRALVALHRSHHETQEDIEHWIAPNVLLGRMAWCAYAEAYSCAQPLMARRSAGSGGSLLLTLGQPAAPRL